MNSPALGEPKHASPSRPAERLVLPGLARGIGDMAQPALRVAPPVGVEPNNLQGAARIVHDAPSAEPSGAT